MRSKQRISVAFVALGAVWLWAAAAGAQQVVLDKPVRAGGLVFFPDVADATAYYYAPTRARLATGATGLPQFSFLRYVENVRTAGPEEVREGEGGGIVHAVVQLGVTDEELKDAERELGRRAPGAKVKGPIIFKSGSFGLVSSFQGEGGQLTTRVVGLGTAPVLDGGKAAVSIQLTKLGAKTLWESFQTATPDISFMFEMEMAGFRSPKRAIIEAELDRIYEHRQFELGVATTYVQAEISDAFDDLYQQGAIRLTQIGEDEKIDALVQTAYSKLVELVFAPAAGQQAQQLAGVGPRKSALDRASELLDKRRQEVREDNARIRSENAAVRQRAQAAAARASSLNSAVANAQRTDDAETVELARGRARRESAVAATVTAAPATGDGGPDQIQQTQDLPGFAAVVTYEMKRSRQRGLYRVDLNKYTADTLPLRFDENIGDLRRYLGNDAVFRNVNLDDPLYRQREVIASLTGVGDKDFDEYLTFVALQLRKKHQSGDETLEEVRVDRAKFNALGNAFKLVYGWKGDSDRSKWQSYEYRALWGFNVGATYESPWQQATFNAIPLTPPVQKRTLQLEADKAPLDAAQVRSVSVQIYSTVGGAERTRQITLNTTRGELSSEVDFVQPAGQQEYEYEIKWRLAGNKTISSGRQKTDQDILYLSDMPEA